MTKLKRGREAQKTFQDLLMLLMVVKVGLTHQTMVSLGIVIKMQKIKIEIMTKTKIISRTHQGAQDHRLEALDLHMVDQRNFQKTKFGKIAGHLVTDQDHVTELQSMKEITRQVEAEVEKDHPTKDKALQTEKRDQAHTGKAVQAQVTKGGQWKL